MEDLHELSRELVRDILNLAEDVEAGPADPEHVASKAEELIEVLVFTSSASIHYLELICLGLMRRVTNQALGSAYQLLMGEFDSLTFQEALQGRTMKCKCK